MATTPIPPSDLTNYNQVRLYVLQKQSERLQQQLTEVNTQISVLSGSMAPKK